MRRLLYLLLFVHLSAWAAPEGRVRVSIDEADTWWVGQRVLVRLDLMTNGFSFSGQRFDLPQLPGAVLLQTDSSTTKLRETIDGESWQVLRYDLSLFGQREGVVDIPAFPVQFGAGMGYGQPVSEFELTTAPLKVELQVPPGVDTSQPVITSPRVTVVEQWHPEQPEFKVGEALTRSVTTEAVDVSAIVLPALPAVNIGGINVLPQAPVVVDRTDRGSLSGHRQEKASYLFTRAGEFTLPGGVISWWNPEQERLETFELESREVKVVPDPSVPPVVSSPAGKVSGFKLRALIIGGVLLLLLAALAFAMWPRKKQVQDTETLRFKRAVGACAANEPKPAWQSVNAWLSMTGMKVPGEGSDTWEALQHAVLSDNQDWKGDELSRLIKHMRRDYLARQELDDTPLPPLNPG